MKFQLPKVVRRKKRLGRGIGSKGAKSGKGMKGQKSRAGWRNRAGFEGGQTPLYMRLPKSKGAKQKFPSQVKKPVTVTLEALERLDAKEIVGPGVLRKAGILSKRSDTWKLVGKEGLKKKLTVRAHAASKGATAAVEKAGGKVELIGK